MKNLTSEKITITDIQRLRSEAESRSSGWYVAAGLLISPILMCCAWYWSHDSVTVRKVGMGIFYIGSIIFALSFMRFSHNSSKLKSLSQINSVTINGVLGPIKKDYGATYDFKQFKSEDFIVYKKMHLWGGILAVGFFALTSWLFTVNFFNYFVWK